jgi:predicted transcriptional regulator
MPLPLIPLGVKLLGLVSGLKIKKVAEFVGKYWKQLIVAGMAAVIVYQNVFETRFFFGAETIPSLEQRLDSAKNELDKAIEANRNLSAAIDDNNKRIEEYEKLSEDLKGKVAELTSDLNEEREKTNKQVEDILKDKTPKSCEESIQYLRDAKDDLKW